MNPIFVPRRGWDGFPPRSYARLDGFEPADLKRADEAVFAFDAIDASWPELVPGGSLDLGSPGPIGARMGALWKGLFGPPRLRPAATLFDKMPIYRVEVTSKRGDRFWGELEALEEGQWVEIALAAAGTYPVDVYGGLVAAAIEAHLVSLARLHGPREASLSALFSTDAWPDASEAEIRALLSGIPAPDRMAVYDVGQGGAAALLDGGGTARVFFDLGAGCYGNSGTRPTTLRFCWRGNPCVVLSHWDTDHWSGEHTDPAARARNWVAPRQAKLGPTHHAFAARILGAGGSLLIWSRSLGPTLSATLASGTLLRLGLCTGSTRNGSGIACLVENPTAAASWLLTGDAGYNQIPLTSQFRLIGIIAPHHGADMTHLGSAPAGPAPAYCRLFYSFGPDNRHGRTSARHPMAAAVGHHQAQGWQHGTWITSAPAATSTAGQDVLATAENTGGRVGPRHLESAVMGWSTSPAVPVIGLPCARPGTSFGCTTDIRQA